MRVIIKNNLLVVTADSAETPEGFEYVTPESSAALFEARPELFEQFHNVIQGCLHCVGIQTAPPAPPNAPIEGEVVPVLTDVVQEESVKSAEVIEFKPKDASTN